MFLVAIDIAGNVSVNDLVHQVAVGAFWLNKSNQSRYFCFILHVPQFRIAFGDKELSEFLDPCVRVVYEKGELQGQIL